MAMQRSLPQPACGSPVDYLCIAARRRRKESAAGPERSLRRDDLGLDGLVLGVRDELRIQQLLGLLQAAQRVVVAGETGGRLRGAHLDAARARAQLLQLAHAALLAPGLILALADAVHRLAL